MQNRIRNWYKRVNVVPPAILQRLQNLECHQLHSEKPGLDGIRHNLVAKIKAEIAAGTYDTEEKWLIAEEKLISRLVG